LPEIMTGIRIGTGVALLATIAAEMLAGQSGLGFLLYDAAFSLRTPEMFAIMATIGALGLLLNALVRQASRIVAGWHIAMTALAGPA
jgi:ABC-type nitrate/sulfonate/bicarbonate transport system permease component